MGGRSWVSLVLALGLLIGLPGPVLVEGHAGRAKEPSLPSDHAGDSGSRASVSTEADHSPANLLQFQAGGRIAGFLPDQVYLASLEHALSVEFPAENRVGFEDKAYDRRYPLTIDSTYRWHTFYPGEASALELDSSGGIYVAGYSHYTWQGPEGEAPLHAHSGGDELMVLRLNGSGAYQWHTFYGAFTGDGERAFALALDGSGGVYVAGHSYYPWQGPEGEAPLHAHSGDHRPDLTVLKLDGNGAYQWHTFYGSADPDNAYALALDGSGGVYVAGNSLAPWDGPEGQAPLHAHSGGSRDLMVLKLDGSGTYQWHTFYGSTNDDIAYALASDGSGDLYLAGNSAGTWDGPEGQPPLHDPTESGGLVVLKLDSSGAYLWHTFYRDLAYALALDGSENVYVAGYSLGEWDGPAGQAPLHTYSGSYDLVVLKLDGNGAYQWHTFYGTDTSDRAEALAVDNSGDVHVAGFSDVTWDGPGEQNPLHAHSGGGFSDLVVLNLDSNGAYGWHTFYGSGDADDYANALALDGTGGVHVAGGSPAAWDGPVGQPPLHAHSGSGDLVVLKLDADGADLALAKTGDPNPVVAGTALTYTLMVNNFGPSGHADVTVTDDLPAGVTFDSYNASQGTFDDTTGQWSAGYLAASQSATLTLLVAVDPGTTGTLLNSASVSGNNFASTDTQVTTEADLAIAKTDDPNPVIAGTPLTYTLVITNDGPSDDADVTVTDALPATVTFDSYDASQGIFDDATGRWSVGYLTAGESATLTLLVTVDPGTTGTFLNSASVSGNATDPQPGNNSASTNTQVTTEGNRPLYLPLVLRNCRTWDPHYEENDHWLAAYGPLTSGQTYLAYPDDEDDYYYFELSSAATVNIRVENFAPTSTYGDLLLYGPATGDDRGPRITYYGQPGHSSMVLEPQSLEPGKYYIRVYVADSSHYSTSRLYTLTVSH
jgi:uncharacterized repeat protein (TIGR01451 family)